MLKLLAAAALAFSCTIAGAEDAAPTHWIVTQTHHEIDGSVDYSASNLSVRPVLGSLGQPDHAILFAYCGRKGLAVGVTWPDIVDRDLSIDAAVLAWSIDGGKVHNDLWDADTTVVGVHGGKARKLLSAIATAQRFVIVVPDRHGAQEAAFNLSGAPAAFAVLPCAKG